jgi:hypothetical protein
MQGDEDQQDECSRILTDMAGEGIVVEQGMLLHLESLQPGSEFGTWQHKSGYGMFSPHVPSMSPYNQLNFEDHMGAVGGLRSVDTQFQTSNFFSDEFDIRSLSKLQEWH